MTLYAATDIANFFIEYYSRSVDLMTLPRVQAFCYFAQAESLCRHGRPLFEDTFRAYSYGPGLTRLEFYYDGYGNSQIGVYKEYDPKIFDKEDRQLLMDVAVYYNMFSTSQLQIMTFANGGPWEQVYSKGTNMLDIDNSIIQEFYEKLPRVPDYKSQMWQAISSSCSIEIMPVVHAEEERPTVVYTEKEVSRAWE